MRIQQAAVAAAAHAILSAAASPDDRPKVDALLAAALDAVPDRPGKRAGVELGRAIAATTRARRAADWRVPLNDFSTGSEPGVWQPTPPFFLIAKVGRYQPFAFSPDEPAPLPPPPALGSSAYLDAVAEVREMGALESARRTPAQTSAAMFWAQAELPSELPCPGDPTACGEAGRARPLDQRARHGADVLRHGRLGHPRLARQGALPFLATDYGHPGRRLRRRGGARLASRSSKPRLTPTTRAAMRPIAPPAPECSSCCSRRRPNPCASSQSTPTEHRRASSRALPRSPRSARHRACGPACISARRTRRGRPWVGPSRTAWSARCYGRRSRVRTDGELREPGYRAYFGT